MLQSLAAQFPGSDWVTNAAATAQYNLRNFDEAQELFEDLLERDPHRIEVRQTAAQSKHSPSMAHLIEISFGTMAYEQSGSFSGQVGSSTAPFNMHVQMHERNKHIDMQGLLYLHVLLIVGYLA